MFRNFYPDDIRLSWVIDKVGKFRDQTEDIKKLENKVFKDNFGAIAHRGALYNTYPNVGADTLPAIRWALDNNYDGVEVDIQYDVNNNIVCFHDDTLDSSTDQTGYLYDIAYTSVHVKSGLDSSVYCDNPALLSDVLQYVAKAGKSIYIDWKYIGDHYVDYSDVIDMCNQYGVEYALRVRTTDIGTVYAIDKKVKIVTNDFNGTTAPTAKQIQTYIDLCPNMIFYMNNTTSGVDETFVELLHSYGCGYISNDYDVFADGILLDSFPVYGGVPKYDSGWIQITNEDLTTGSVGTGNYVPYYRRVGNTVYLRGLVQTFGKTALPTDASTRFEIMKLPAGFRPAGGNYRIMTCGNSSPNIFATLQIASGDGQVLVFNVDKDCTISELNLGLFLDGVSFSC